jgi:hypothetical protein
MKKLFSCCMIVALCASVMLLGACTRTKEHRTQVTTGAAVNAMMATNPLGSMFGKTQLSEESAVPALAQQAAVSGVGCPAIDIGLEAKILPPKFEGRIDLAYNNDCIVHGLEMSGGVASTWSFKIIDFEVQLESTVDFDNLTMEGRHTDGSLHQLLYVKHFIPYAEIDGTLTTTHADGKTRTMVFEKLVATVDLGNFTEFHTIFPSISITDNNTAALVINGSAQYTNEDAMTSAMTFVDVKQPFGCIMPTSGTVHMVNEKEGYDATIDYGDENICDTLIIVTLKDEEPQEIDVRDWMKNH